MKRWTDLGWLTRMDFDDQIKYLKLPLAMALTAAVTAERRRIIALAREFGTEPTAALADLLEEDDAP